MKMVDYDKGKNINVILIVMYGAIPKVQENNIRNRVLENSILFIFSFIS